MSKQAIRHLLQIVDTSEARSLLQDALDDRFVNYKTALNCKIFSGGPFYVGSAYHTLAIYFKHAVRGHDLSNFEDAIERFAKRPKLKAVKRHIPQPSQLK
jgi:hypothetical protein